MGQPDPSERAYLSIIAWPEGADESDRIAAIVAATELDPYTSRMISRRGVPQVAVLIPADDASRILPRLRERGVLAVAPERGELGSLSDPVRAMHVGHPRTRAHLIGLSIHNGEDVEFDPAAVSAILRATVQTSKTTIEPQRRNNDLMLGAAMLGGLPGMALAASSKPESRRTSESALRELVEIQLVDGRRYRLDSRAASGSRAERLKPGRQRMDELACRLSEFCPRAWVDQRFREFHCPPDVLRTASSVTGAKTVRTKDDWPLFEFYSAWTMLMLREIAA